MNKVDKNIYHLSSESFASFLRRHRIQTQKTMGQVARELGITIVYYSEVEAGKKPAFPEKKVDYKDLATALKTTIQELRQVAEADRERRHILKVFECDSQSAELAVAFGRRLANKNLSEKQMEKIRKILHEVD